MSASGFISVKENSRLSGFIWTLQNQLVLLSVLSQRTGSRCLIFPVQGFIRTELRVRTEPVLLVLQTVEKLLGLLGTLDRWINETPPVDQPSRFGNKAYRTWFSKLEQVGSEPPLSGPCRRRARITFCLRFRKPRPWWPPCCLQRKPPPLQRSVST